MIFIRFFAVRDAEGKYLGTVEVVQDVTEIQALKGERRLLAARLPDARGIRPRRAHVDPRLIGHDIAYPAMLRFLPAGFVGLMVGGLVAANSSTILTHLNWGASYLVHDFYRRFLQTDATEAALRAAGRVATVLLFVCRRRWSRARHGEGRVRHHPADRRRHRAALPGALVLVARQRVVRSGRDGQLVRRLGRAARAARRRIACRHAPGAGDDRSRRRCAGWRRPISAPETDREVLTRSTGRCGRPGPAGSRSAPRWASRPTPPSAIQLRWRCSAGRSAARWCGRRCSPSGSALYAVDAGRGARPPPRWRAAPRWPAVRQLWPRRTAGPTYPGGSPR